MAIPRIGGGCTLRGPAYKAIKTTKLLTLKAPTALRLISTTKIPQRQQQLSTATGGGASGGFSTGGGGASQKWAPTEDRFTNDHAVWESQFNGSAGIEDVIVLGSVKMMHGHTRMR